MFYDDDDDMHEPDFDEIGFDDDSDMDEIELPSEEFVPEEEEAFLNDLEDITLEDMEGWYTHYIENGGA